MSSRPAGWPEPRIGDVEREGAAWALGEHFAAGRLTQDEYEERAGQAWKARTHSDLAPLFGDLPQPHGRPVRAQPQPVPPAPPPPPRRHWLNVWFFVLMALVIFGVVAEAPWLLVPFLLAAVVLHQRGRRRSTRRPPRPHR